MIGDFVEDRLIAGQVCEARRVDILRCSREL